MLNNEVRLTQGKEFDGYDERENDRIRLCNVISEVFKNTKRDQYVEIDFDGDNETIWNGIVTSKNQNNHTLYVYLP
ncbi:MAG: hypothetical protein MR398_05545 [Oscillospiraceae bacterium]|nr:hypothetical protein [Oscillospiraceae bacterium]